MPPARPAHARPRRPVTARPATARSFAGAPHAGVLVVGVLLLGACTAGTETEATLTVESPDGSATAVARLVDPETGEAVDVLAEERLRIAVPGAVPHDGTSGAGGQGAGSGLPPVLDRALLEEQVTQRSTCDGGDLRVPAGDAVEVSGACATLTVTGAGARVVARDVGRLVVQGAGAQVVVATADVVVVDAEGARVAWEDGIPEVTSSTGDGAGYGPVGVVRLDAG